MIPWTGWAVSWKGAMRRTALELPAGGYGEAQEKCGHHKGKRQRQITVNVPISVSRSLSDADIQKKAGTISPGGGPGICQNDRRAHELRRFYIQNEYGRENRDAGRLRFLSDPAGLGFSDSVEYMAADGFYRDIPGGDADRKKTGTLVFLPAQAYAEYREFASWVFAAKRLTLAYSADGDCYFCDVDITDMEKAELGPGGVLEVPVTFMPLSPWCSPYDLNLTMEEGMGGIRAMPIPAAIPIRPGPRCWIFSVTAQIPAISSSPFRGRCRSRF